MNPDASLKIALVGNPNAGKTSIFNLLTGLNQKTGNFAGVTTDKKIGFTALAGQNQKAQIIDLPGIYSLYPKSEDEKVAIQTLLLATANKQIDGIILLADSSNLKRSLLLFSQIHDLGFPIVLALTMPDIAAKMGILIDYQLLSQQLGVPIISIDGRRPKNILEFKQIISDTFSRSYSVPAPFYSIPQSFVASTQALQSQLELTNNYAAFLLLQQPSLLTNAQQIELIKQPPPHSDTQPKSAQAAETIFRYGHLHLLTNKTISQTKPAGIVLTQKIDHWLTHRFFGPLFFLIVLTFIFQAVFSLAAFPMDLIDQGIGELALLIQNLLPDGPVSNLLTTGIVPAIGGILIFTPQIAILFALLSVLEQSGYMARAIYILDRLMRKFGLNGRSVVPLISAVACAIPAIMAARTITNARERLITILVTPWMSCSARLPIYIALTGILFGDEKKIWGIFGYQGLALMGLYLLSTVATLAAAWIFKKILKQRQASFFVMELPVYRLPNLKTIGLQAYEKVMSFITNAGKIILAISIILWGLASYGPSDSMAQADVIAKQQAQKTNIDFEQARAAARLEASYVGILGKAIEPSIRPLGFDWKIGIALIASFAAREVFVGTIATVYSLGQASDQSQQISISDKLRSQKNAQGQPQYSPAVCVSLLIFYVFAMQCMSTFAIVRRETLSWKWPFVQLFFMTATAWLASFLVYQLLK